MQQKQSKATNLMMQIQAEYEAGRHVPKKLPQDLQDYFINLHVKNMEHYQQELIALVGAEQAFTMLAKMGL